MKNPKELFEGLEIRDLRVKTSTDCILLAPNYLNYSFVSIILGILFGVFLYGAFGKKDNGIESWFLLGMILLLIAMLLE